VNSKLNYHKLVKSITYKKNIIVLKVKPKEDLGQYIFWDAMINILSKHKPQIDILASSNNGILIVIAENAYTKIHYDDLKNEFDNISDCEIVKDKILVTLVGADLSSIENLEQRIFICNPKVKAELVIFGYNQHSFSLLISADYFDLTMKNLHREFFEIGGQNTKLFEKRLDKKDKSIAQNAAVY